MVKMTFQDLKNLFSVASIKPAQKISKHQAGKKGYKHQHNLSKGELNHQKFINK